MWLLLIPLGLAWWSYRRRHDYREVRGRPLFHGFHGWRGYGERGEERRFTHPAHRAGAQSMLALPAPTGQPIAPIAPGNSGTADYLKHVRDAARCSAALDYFAQGPALAGDVQTLMGAPGELEKTLAALSAPMDVITIQRDLNVLGCSPPLHESGEPDAPTTQAIKALQARFGQVPTGEVDSDTCVAIRYSVGNLYGQDSW